jgi:hypothetical protein
VQRSTQQALIPSALEPAPRDPHAPLAPCAAAPAPAAEPDDNPRCCRALGQLRALQEMSLRISSSEQDAHYSPAAGMYRPVWPSLAKLTIGQVNMLGLCPLHVLARCTDIPTTCTTRFQLGVGNVKNRPLAVKDWGAGWLHAAFTHQGFFAHHGLRYAPVMLVDDGDVDAYIGALGGLDSTQLQFRHSLCLGEAVSPAGLHRLASAPNLPSGSLCIAGPLSGALEPYMVGWRASVTLSAEHFKALPSASGALSRLKSFSVADGSLLSDLDVAMLAAAAPSLQTVRLQNAVGLTDAALYALLRCQQLSALHVTKAAQLTSSGVLALLALSTMLVKLIIPCGSSSAADAVVEDVRGLGPVAAGWCWRFHGGSMTWTRGDTRELHS